MKRIAAKLLTLLTFLAVLAPSASADTLMRSRYNPHFSNNRVGGITFRWVSPVPSRVIISRYNGGWNSNPSQQVVYDGAPPSSLTLQGGGTKGGGRYTITAPGQPNFKVQISGPNIVNW